MVALRRVSMSWQLGTYTVFAHVQVKINSFEDTVIIILNNLHTDVKWHARLPVKQLIWLFWPNRLSPTHSIILDNYIYELWWVLLTWVPWPAWDKLGYKNCWCIAHDFAHSDCGLVVVVVVDNGKWYKSNFWRGIISTSATYHHKATWNKLLDFHHYLHAPIFGWFLVVFLRGKVVWQCMLATTTTHTCTLLAS